MARRFRIRLTVILVVLGIPLVLASLFVFSTATGYFGSVISVEYARVMPGHLTVGDLKFVAADEVHLTDIRIAEGLAKPLVRIAAAEAKIDIFNRRLKSLRLHGVSIRLDADSFNLLQRIIDAGDKFPPSNPPQKWHLEADGDAEFSSGMQLTGLHCAGEITGSLFEIEGGGLFEVGGKPFKARVAGRYQGTPAPGVPPSKRISVFLDEAEGPLPEALAAVAAIGLLPPAPPSLLRWLPKHIVANGSVIHRDLGVLRFVVPAKVTWTDAQGRPGAIDALLNADAARIEVKVSRFEDPAVGRFGTLADTAQDKVNGTLLVDLQPGKNALRFMAPRFVAGPGLGIPPSIPLDAIIRQVPRIDVNYRFADEATAITLSAAKPSQASVNLAWIPGSPIRIDATELPLPLIQNWLPADLVVTGGQATKASIVLNADKSLSEATLRDLTLTVSQGRATWGGWTVGPLDGLLSLTPQPAGKLHITAKLALGEMDGTVTQTGGVGRIQIETIDVLLTRLHGPLPLPSITGGLAVDLAWERTPDQLTTITVPKAVLTNADIRIADKDRLAESHDLLRQVDATLRGTVTINAAGTIATRAGGQLIRGQFRLPGNWLDLAAHTPIFTVATEITRAKELQFRMSELLVRAADVSGTPLTNSYSAQFSGQLDGVGSGIFTGLVDHADLGWVNHQIGLPVGAVDGEGALTCEATFTLGQVERLTGHFLPLNAAVQLGPRFHASGITGAVDFTLDRSALEEKKP